MGKVILTNDDGIEGAGLWALQSALHEAWDWAIVAPLHQHSGCGHQTTTHRPIKIDKRAENIWAIDGTPADCIRIAVCQLYADQTIDLVLSGINDGANLGVDVYTSGTVAAVREASFHHLKGIAISHYKIKNKPMDWQWASTNTARVLHHIFNEMAWQDHRSYWNVNLPHCPEVSTPPIVTCPLSIDPLPCEFALIGDEVHYTADYELRQRSPQTDVDKCFGGCITLTSISL
jgi:5'-nucleotidase